MEAARGVNRALVDILNMIERNGPATEISRKEVITQFFSKKVDFTFDDIVTLANRHHLIFFDPGKNVFKRRTKYPIEDFTSLNEYIRNNPEGLPIDIDLFSCYRGVQGHVGILRQSPAIRVIKTNEKKEREIFFYKDREDPVEIEAD